MNTLITVLLFSFIGLYSCWFFPQNGEKCCPESSLGVMCENSTARTYPICGRGKQCCLRLDLAFDCCDEATEVCEPQNGGCIPKANSNRKLTTVRIGIFSESLSFAIARQRFLWVQEDLDVQYVMVRGSINQYQMLRDKEVDFIASGIDNAVNYAINSQNPLGNKKIKTISVAATDLGQNLAIVVLPNITTFDDLRNTIVGVDAAASGFAYNVYDILASGGLTYGSYHVVEVGGTQQRFNSLLAGESSAVLLNGEFLIRAQALGYKILRAYSDIKNPIALTSAISVPPDYLLFNATIIHKFLKAYYIATQYLVNPLNRDAIINLITQAGISSNPALFYEYSTSPKHGVKNDSIITPQGLYEIVASRNRYNGFVSGHLSNKAICDLIQPVSLFNLDGLYDTSHLRLAVWSLGYSFNDKNQYNSKTCKELGLKIESENSANAIVMPVALFVSVVVALLFI